MQIYAFFITRQKIIDVKIYLKKYLGVSLKNIYFAV